MQVRKGFSSGALHSGERNSPSQQHPSAWWKTRLFLWAMAEHVITQRQRQREWVPPQGFWMTISMPCNLQYEYNVNIRKNCFRFLSRTPSQTTTTTTTGEHCPANKQQGMSCVSQTQIATKYRRGPLFFRKPLCLALVWKVFCRRWLFVSLRVLYSRVLDSALHSDLVRIAGGGGGLCLARSLKRCS